ncbi:putative glucan 1,3-beta-glucosidase [Helianthus anomalus]
MGLVPHRLYGQLMCGDTFGALAPDAVRFLKRVQQVVSSNTVHVKGQNFVFSRVGFAIQKGVAAQLVARLPAISLDPLLIKKIGAATALEVRATGIQYTFAPCIAVSRSIFTSFS